MPQPTYAQIIIAHNSELLSAGIRSKLKRKFPQKIKWVADASSLLALLSPQNPDVVILDETLQGLQHQTVPQIKSQFPQIKIILFTGQTNIQFFQNMSASGVSAFVHLHTPIKEFVKAIPAAMDNKPFCCSVINRVFNHSNTETLLILIAKLTEIELKEFYNWKNRLPEKECANMRGIGRETIKTTRNRIKSKLEKTGLLYLIEKPVNLRQN